MATITNVDQEHADRLARLTEADLDFIVYNVLPLYMRQMEDDAEVFDQIVANEGHEIMGPVAAGTLAKQFRAQKKDAADLIEKLMR